LARATLGGLALQVYDLMEAAAENFPGVRRMRVDGGAARNNLLMQMQADLLGIPIERSAMAESTALGAAFLAGLATGVWSGVADVARLIELERTFPPAGESATRARLLARWHAAVRSVIRHYTGR